MWDETKRHCAAVDHWRRRRQRGLTLTGWTTRAVLALVVFGTLADVVVCHVDTDRGGRSRYLAVGGHQRD